MKPELKEKLKNKLVDTGTKINQTKRDKLGKARAYADLIKQLERTNNAILRALAEDNEQILIDVMGEFYENELGIKNNHKGIEE